LVKSDLATDEKAAADIRLVSLGAMAGPEIALPSGALRGARLTILGSGTGNFPPLDRLQAIVADILARTSRGEIGLQIESAPLAEVARIWSGQAGTQRIVLQP
jgi:hypothetical protein